MSSLHKVSIDIPEASRLKIIELLQARLVDTIDLFTQAKQAHWTIKGPAFIAVHELFDDVAGEVNEHADTIAERIEILGGQALGTARVVAKTSSLSEYPVGAVTQDEHIKAMTAAMATYAKAVRKAIDSATEYGDADTADLFTGVSRAIDKQRWFVESHLSAGK